MKKENPNLLGWTSSDNGETYGPRNNIKPIHSEDLPPGYYSIQYVPIRGIYFEKISLKEENLIQVAGTQTDDIIKDLTKFWSRRDLFEKYKFPYKRGILMYGMPGCGKSCTISLLCREVISKGGICLKFGNTELLIRGLKMIAKQQKEVPILVIMEDLDQLLEYNNMSDLLNLLDGVSEGTENIIYLATTNNPEMLHENIKNRPSRFDKRIEFGPPEPELRRAYIKSLFLQDESLPIDIDQWVTNSEGLSFAHLKELFISTVLFGNDFQETLVELRNMGVDEEVDHDFLEELSCQAEEFED